jgi:hypothetical protein
MTIIFLCECSQIYISGRVAKNHGQTYDIDYS